MDPQYKVGEPKKRVGSDLRAIKLGRETGYRKGKPGVRYSDYNRQTRGDGEKALECS